MEAPSSSKKKRIKRGDTDSDHGGFGGGRSDSEAETAANTSGPEGNGDDETNGDTNEFGEEEVEEEDDDVDIEAFIQEERTKMSALIEAFTDEELKRYEAARRCALNVKDVKSTMEAVLGRNAKGAAEKTMQSLGIDVPNVDEKTVTVVNGLTKLYLRELIELACVICDERDEGGAKIQPKHLREAYRRMKLSGRVPNNRQSNGLN